MIRQGIYTINSIFYFYRGFSILSSNLKGFPAEKKHKDLYMTLEYGVISVSKPLGNILYGTIVSAREKYTNFTKQGCLLFVRKM